MKQAYIRADRIKSQGLEQHMIAKSDSKYVLMLMILVVSVGLIACSPQAAAPTPTVPPATIEPTAVPVSEEPTATLGTAESAATEAVAATVECTRLNLNDVTEDALLVMIPDFSNRMVREFFEYRPYVSIQQFRREIGKYVDEAQVAEYEQYVYVPVDPNDSDADSLMQIPGVDETVANQLIEDRPYESNDAFMTALGASLDAGQLEEAACYLAATA
jgi:hypothetical protein